MSSPFNNFGSPSSVSLRLVRFAYYTAIIISMFTFIAFTIESSIITGLVASTCFGIVFAIAMKVFMERINGIQPKKANS